MCVCLFGWLAVCPLAMNRTEQLSVVNYVTIIHPSHFYSAFLSPLLFRSAPDTARILCRSFTSKRNRQLQVKDLPQVPGWRLDLFAQKAFKTSMQNFTAHAAPSPIFLDRGRPKLTGAAADTVTSAQGSNPVITSIHTMTCNHSAYLSV